MTEPRARRIEALFQRACDLPTDQRSAFLQRECRDDAELVSEVQSLLAHIDLASPEFLEGDSSPEAASISSVGASATNSYDSVHVPHRIGRYEIIRLIGVGGMGTVYEAEQDTPRRRVALKVLRGGVDRDMLLRRFEREASLLAVLQHPAITHVYESGVAEGPSGRLPYIAMEYIDGAPINEWGRASKRSITQRLTLVAEIADGVHHAHQRGIVHRDLKPANILVTQAARPKILDFGIARVTDMDIQTVTLTTEVGQLMGTVPYMSPEQVLGDSSRIEATSDVYALGVLIFELLADRLPLDIRGRSIPDAVSMIREQEPSRLSTIDSRYRGDIETIVLKALEKEPDRRYQSAAELASDLRRHMRNEPIQARPATPLYQMRKFAQRNRKLVAAALFAFVTLTVTSTITTISAVNESRMRRVADEERNNARSAAYRSSLIASQAAMHTHDYINARRILESVHDEYRNNWEWRHLHSRLDSSDIVLTAHDAAVTSIMFSSDGRRLVSSSLDGSIGVWDAETHVRLQTLRGHDGAVMQALFAPDGEHIISRGADETIRVWNTANQQPPIVIRVETSRDRARIQRFSDMDVSPDGTLIAATHQDRLVRLWETRTGRPVSTTDLRRARGYDLRTISFVPDDQNHTLLIGWLKGLLRWVPADQSDQNDPPDVEYHQGTSDFPPDTIAHHPQSNQIATGCGDKSVVLWSANTLEPLRKLTGHTAAVTGVAIHPTGKWVASSSRDQTVRVWDVATGRQAAVCPGHTDSVAAVAWSPDGAWLASSSHDNTIRLWRTDELFNRAESHGAWSGVIQSRIYRGHDKYVYDIEFDPTDPSGRRAVSVGWDGRINIWDAASLTTLRTVESPVKSLRCVAVDRTRGRIAVGSRNRHVTLFDNSTGDVIRSFAAPRGNISSVAISADGTRLIACRAVDHSRQGRGAAVIWNIESGEEALRRDDPAWYIPANRGSRLLMGAFDCDESRMLDAQSGDTICVFDGSPQRVLSLAYSDDGSRFVVGLENGDARVRDATTGTLIATLHGHNEATYDAAFSPDMTRIATCSNDNTIRIWDAATYEVLLELRGHDHYVHALAFSPDGAMLVSASGDTTLRVWDTLPRHTATGR